MNKLQKFCVAVILTAIFTLSAFAGDISMPGVTNPPPPQREMVTSGSFSDASAEGYISSSDVAALDPVTELTLNLLQSCLPLF